MTSSDDGFLDTGQYTRESIASYEAIYGRDFVSPGGRETAAALVARLRLVPGQRVLDAGCGLGGAAFLMAREHGVRVIAVDVSTNMVTEARRRTAAYGLVDDVHVVQADCATLDLDGAVDAVHSRDVFLHVTDKEKLFAALYRALVPGGRLLITDYCAGPPAWSPEFQAYVDARDYDLRTIADYALLLEAAGFAEVIAEDRTGQFISIHAAELERLATVDLPSADRAELEAGWQAKIVRARDGEQRWGLFTGRRPSR